MIDARVAEVYDFARIAGDGLRESSERAGSFRAAIDAIGSDVSNGLQASGVRLAYVPPESDASAVDPISDLSAAVGQIAESDYEFALSLEGLVANQTLLQPGASLRRCSSTFGAPHSAGCKACSLASRGAGVLADGTGAAVTVTQRPPQPRS